MTTYVEWCVANSCTHGHCPFDCEHPQPIVLDDGRCVCGRCLVIDKVITEMLPCVPAVCGGDHATSEP
jgi:hypothetical protein